LGKKIFLWRIFERVRVFRESPLPIIVIQGTPWYQLLIKKLFTMSRTQKKLYVTKINWTKGTIVVADVPLTSKEFEVNGFKATTSNGQSPTKMGWFKLVDFNEDIFDAIKEAFKLGTPCQGIKFGKAVEGSEILHDIVPA
tara:strand:+ start:368 stop:787 length:420 start_codon:yes stop_codon:yes gene_type:complete